MVCRWMGIPRSRRAWPLAKRLLHLFLLALVRRAHLEGRIEGRGEPEYQFRAGPFLSYQPNTYRTSWFGVRRRSLRRRARRQVLKGGLGRFWLRILG